MRDTVFSFRGITGAKLTVTVKVAIVDENLHVKVSRSESK